MTWLNALRKAAGWEKAHVDVAKGDFAYDHDAVGDGELAELLGDPGSELVPAVPQPQQAVSENIEPEREVAPEPEFEVELELEVEADCPLDEDDLASQTTVIAASTQQFDFDVPDVDISEAEAPEDFVPDVQEARRARQLAAMFLLRLDDLTAQNVDLIADIIASRRWSSAQLRVLALLQAGYSVRQVHAAFLIAETWRHSDVFDERFDVGYPNPRLSWLEAIELSEFFGGSGDVEDMLVFAERERLIWRDDFALRARFPSFKQYLVHHRIRSEYKHRDLGCWTRTLDPRDGRYFDGTGNPEYSNDWWDDDIADRWSRTGMSLRIYRGASFEGLVLERMSLHDWSED